MTPKDAFNPRHFTADRQAVVTSIGVRKTRPHPGRDGNPADANCPVCGGRRLEMYMRATVHKNDPMTCGDCGHFFVAADIPGMWS
jgi:hypothetical protein